MTERGSDPGGKSSYRKWAVEFAPIVLVTICLAVKLFYVSVSLRNTAWWVTEESRSAHQWLWSHPRLVASTLGSTLILVAPLLLLRRAARFFALLLLDLFVSSVVIADLLHFSFYGDIPSLFAYSNVATVTGAMPSIVNLLELMHGAFLLDVILMAPLLPWYTRAFRGVGVSNFSLRCVLAAAGLAIGTVLMVPGVRLTRHDSDLVAVNNLQRDVASHVGVLPYHIWDLAAYTSARQDRERGQIEPVGCLFLASRGTEPPRSSLFGVARGRNVILVSMESVQAFAIGLKVRGQLVTPNLSRFAEESLVFGSFFDQTYLGTTADGEFTTLQSLHPLPVGNIARYNGNHFFGLPAILRERGYSTLAAVASDEDFWSRKYMHPSLGFQRGFYENAFRIKEQFGLWMSDRDFFQQAADLLERQPRPFMVFLLTSSTHHPYHIPERERELELGTLNGTKLGDYLHAVHYLDRAFGEFTDRLKQEGLLDESLIVLYGDHQAYLGDPVQLVRVLGLREPEEYRKMVVRKKVPLIIRLPHGEAAGPVSTAGGQLDTAPTILGLLGIQDHSRVMLGRDLMSQTSPMVVFRDGSFTDGTHFFVNRFGSDAICYDARSGARTACGPLQHQRRQALQRLRVSDTLIRSDGVRQLKRWLEHGKFRQKNC